MIQIKISDLQKMPKQELAAIAQNALKLKEARKKKTLESYLETANPGQNEFHRAKKRIRFLLGANRSGKSEGGVAEDLFWSTGTHPFRKIKTPNKGLVVLQDFENHAKNIFEPKFTSRAPSGIIERAERNQNGAWRKLTLTNGSVIDILSHDQDIKVFEGSDYDWAHFDEPPPQRIFNAVWRGLTDRGGHTWITATPLGLGPWMYAEVKKCEKGEDPLRWYRYMAIWENAKNIGEGDEELGKQRIKEFLEMLPPEERQARETGQFLQLQGLIFKDWNRAHHLIPPFGWPSEWPIYESIDPHPSKPWAVAWIGAAENGAKVLLRSGLYEGVIDEIAQQILYERTQLNIQHDRRPRIVRTLIDNASSVPLWSRSYSDPTARRRSVREELESMIGPLAGGPRVEVAPKNVSSKIELFKGLLHIKASDSGNASGFYAFDVPENERFIAEIENYCWDTKRGGLLNGMKDTPVKKDDDILDAIMQVVLTLPKEGVTYERIRTVSTERYRV